MEETSEVIENVEESEEVIEQVISFELPDGFADDLYTYLSSLVGIESFTLAAILILIGVMLALIFVIAVRKV